MSEIHKNSAQWHIAKGKGYKGSFTTFLSERAKGPLKKLPGEKVHANHDKRGRPVMGVEPEDQAYCEPVVREELERMLKERGLI